MDNGVLRVLIVDHNVRFRETVRRVLVLSDRCQVVGEADSGEAAVALAHRLRSDLVLMDVHLPNMSGLAALERIAAAVPQAKVALLLSQYTAEYRAAAHQHGAFACIAKDHLEEHLAWTLERIASRAQGERPGPEA